MKKRTVSIKNILILFIFVMIFASCNKRLDKEASIVLKKLTLEQKIGQMIMVAVPGQSVTKKTIKILEKYKPGGILFFGFNLKDQNQIKKFTSNLQKVAYEKYSIPLFITLDQEGGRVRRIASGVTQFPGNMAAGIGDNKSLVFNWASILGYELRALGINMNLAPVLDINNNPENPVINTRSFSSDLTVVSDLGISYVRGLQENGVVAVGKHFPGHGDTSKDSHITLPVINYDMERLRRVELVPFKKSIDAGLDVVMTAHISFPKILGNKNSATVSKYFLDDVLRKELKFKGVVITDDMEMGAISNKMNAGEASVVSIKAGSDIVLISTFGKSIPLIFNEILKAVNSGKISVERIDQSVRRILELKLRYDILSYKDGKISPGVFVNKKNTNELLKKKEKINQKLSEDGIYYSGEKNILKDNETTRVYLIKNLTLLKSLKFKKEDVVIENIHELERLSICSCEKAVIYYEMNHFKKKEYERAISYAKKRKWDINFIVSGNPFKFAKNLSFGSMLISFSNTEESIKALGSVINGEIEPKYEIKLNLGFKSGK